MNEQDEDEVDPSAFLELIKGANLGVTIPTLTSGSAKVYSLEGVLEILLEQTDMQTNEILKCIRNMNHRYLGEQNPVFITNDEDLRAELGFQL